MNPEILYWPLSLFCLWIPSALIFSKSTKDTLRHPVRRRDEGLLPLLRSGVNWLDFVRAAFGAWILVNKILAPHSSQDDTRMVYTIYLLATLLIGVLAQTFWIDRPLRVIGPIFFISGMTLGISGLAVGGFALILGFTCALMLRRVSLVFVFVPFSVVVFAFMFQQFGVLTELNAVLFLLPGVLAFGLGTRPAFVRTRMLAKRRAPDRGGPASRNAGGEPEIAAVQRRFTAGQARAAGATSAALQTPAKPALTPTPGSAPSPYQF